MESAWNFPDGNIADLLQRRHATDPGKDIDHRLHAHSSLIRRLAREIELEGHQGCVNALAWNSKGTLLISGSDDTRINIWSYMKRSLVHSIDTGHSANIFCTRFIPETSDELVVSGAGDAEVRVFHLSRSSGRSCEQLSLEPSAHFQCHSRRVKKLAVEIGNPNVVWSASEDGTLRQHDLREGASCPPAGNPTQECRNVLLDLRSGAKKSLAECPKHCLLLKSCDISPTRPHQLLVGGSDAFGRLYDRRMLPPLSSCRTKMKPPPCVTYFCPIHLSERRSSSLHLTHVAFSPIGEEVLLSYSGEHVYLMNVNHDDQISMRYCADDIPKRTYLPPAHSELEAFQHQPVSSNNVPRRKGSSRLDMYIKLFQSAAQSLEEGSNYLHGIEACSEILDGKGPEIDDVLKHECLCTRAALFLKRKWKNDVHMAIRDCHRARAVDALSFRSYYYLAEALMQLGKYQEALDCATAAHYLAPLNPEVAEQIKIIKEQLLAAEAERRSKENEAVSRSEMQPGRRRTLSDVLFRSEASDDASEGGRHSEREDSDYEEMELDFVTSLSGDENHDLESRIFRGSLNLRFHRGDESSSYSNESPSSSTQNENAAYKHEFAMDMKQRYVGHCNVGTDIKQASFLGHQGEHIASGSDDGRWFIWEKRTGRLVKILLGDDAVVNCVQCHPFDCTVATSGIDNTIKIWTPHSQMPSLVGGTAGPETADVLSIIASNQQKLFRNREMLPFEFLERFRMHDFSEGNFHPFECAQS